MRRTIAAFALALAILALAGCGGSEKGKDATSAATSETTTEQYPRSGLQTYETPDQIHADLDTRFNCLNFKRTTGSRTAASSGNCDLETSDGGSQQLIMTIFSADANKQEQIGIYRSVGEMLDTYGFVEGGNWLVYCEAASICQPIAEVLGGRVETLPVVASN